MQSAASGVSDINATFSRLLQSPAVYVVASGVRVHVCILLPVLLPSFVGAASASVGKCNHSVEGSGAGQTPGELLSKDFETFSTEFLHGPTWPRTVPT